MKSYKQNRPLNETSRTDCACRFRIIVRAGKKNVCQTAKVEGGRGLRKEYGEGGENLKLQENTEKGAVKVNASLFVMAL